jgi:macrodomain Ter protein organizer (MatP/YcbG family)
VPKARPGKAAANPAAEVAARNPRSTAYSTRLAQYSVLFKLREVKTGDVDDSQYLHALTYVDLDNETLRQLQSDNEWRLHALGSALDYIVTQRTVPEQKMKSVLTDQQFTAYVESFNWSMSHVEDDQSDEIPWQLQEYMQQIRRGDRYTRIANLFKHAKKRDYNGRTAYQRYLHKAESCYEEAVMDLLNYIDTDPKTNANVDAALAGEILRCLDRDVTAKHGDAPDISASGVPRVRGTKSKYTQVDAQPVIGQRLRRYWRQREALCSAALELLYDEPEEDTASEKQMQELRERMQAKFGIKVPERGTAPTGKSKLQQILDATDDDE